MGSIEARVQRAKEELLFRSERIPFARARLPASFDDPRQELAVPQGKAEALRRIKNPSDFFEGVSEIIAVRSLATRNNREGRYLSFF